MSLEVQGRISLKVFFNGKELPLGYGNGVVILFLHMSCSTRLAVPMLHMKVTDQTDFLINNKLLFDGCLITIVIGDQSSQSTTYEFRLNSFTNPNSLVADNRVIELDGYLNLTRYWQSTAYAPFTGTTSALIGDIAAKCALNYVSDKTSDSQTWFPRNLPYYEWARTASERGYKSDTSCMQLGIDLSKTAVYKDVASMESPIAKISVGKPKPGYIFALDASPSSSPGAKNNLSGYSSSFIEQDLLAPTYKATSKLRLATRTDSKSLAINSEIKSEVGAGRVRFSPIDAGNVHINYEQALYQNRRITNLFVNKLEIIVKEPTRLKLLDCVQVVLDNQHRDVENFGGTYRISSRVVYFQGMDYMEKLELTSRSVAYTSDKLIAG
jgi:hypothetical protein